MSPRALLGLLLVLSACRGSDDAADAGHGAPGIDKTTRAPVSPSDPCDALTRRQCLSAPHCRLAGRGPVYECRPVAGPCETGLAQTDKAGCEHRPECEFRPGNCYCPCKNNGATKAGDDDGEGCACACGGGTPPACVAKGSAPPANDHPRR